jgi:hypothetical protein
MASHRGRKVWNGCGFFLLEVLNLCRFGIVRSHSSRYVPVVLDVHIFCCLIQISKWTELDISEWRAKMRGSTGRACPPFVTSLDIVF